jgi:hypothetical protein
VHREQSAQKLVSLKDQGNPMTTNPNRKPPKSDARIGGMVATVVLVFLAVFTVIFVWIS